MSFRLNLACGTDIRDGWFNLDVVPRWPSAPRGCDMLWDARTDRIPFADGSAGEVYAGYLFLHLAPRYHAQVLAEIDRVMKPGATLVVREVDMDVVLRRYLSNPRDGRACELIWGEQGEGHGDGFADFDKHCHGFTEASLRELLAPRFRELERLPQQHPDIYYDLLLRMVK
jgi:hypothetical protein